MIIVPLFSGLSSEAAGHKSVICWDQIASNLYLNWVTDIFCDINSTKQANLHQILSKDNNSWWTLRPNKDEKINYRISPTDKNIFQFSHRADCAIHRGRQASG